ncbi:MAG: hypothetical protein EXQ69_08600 [Acidimicrobiia bacterium]|nr:hypothetical protein [Acidimicrobiia bacterium]
MGELRTIPLTARQITDEAWEPYGWLPVDDSDARDAEYNYEFTWGDAHVNVITHGFDEVEHTATGSICRWFFRHNSHTQVLMGLNVDSIVAVAPADVDFSDPSHLDSVSAFVIRPLESLVLGRGTWHWGPYPLGPEPVRLFNVQGKGFAQDNVQVELPAKIGAQFEVLS